jgi:hypothetical protein
LRVQRASLEEPERGQLEPDSAVAWLRTLGESWLAADVPDAKADRSSGTCA